MDTKSVVTTKVLFLSANKNLHYPAADGVSHYFKAGELLLESPKYDAAIADLRASIKRGNGGIFWEGKIGETAPAPAQPVPASGVATGRSTT